MAADSPQMPTQMPASWAALAVRSMRRRMAGWPESKRLLMLAFIRSAARVYWVRSLVPMEKKSTSLASTSAMTAAAGVSIMMPYSTSWL